MIKPLTKKQQEQFAKALEEINAIQEKYKEEQKTAPYRNFITEAQASGFSKEQAEFLWQMKMNLTPMGLIR